MVAAVEEKEEEEGGGGKELLESVDVVGVKEGRFDEGELTEVETS